MRPIVEWVDWMEDPEHVRSPPPVYARPAGLGSLGSNSYFIEPYKIRSPHRVHIGRDVGIGERSVLSVVESFMGVRYEPVLRIGDGCSVGPDLHVACAGTIEIGARVAISSRVFIGDSARDYEDPAKAVLDGVIDEPAGIHIGDGAAIGLGAIVMPGVTIGERGIVSAGSVVTRDVPARAVVFGNPARIVRSWDEEIGQWVSGPVPVRSVPNPEGGQQQ